MNMDKVRAPNQVPVTTTGVDQSAIGPNMRRKSILISAPSAGRVTFSFVGTAVLDQGITMPAGVAPFWLHGDNVGDAIRNEIRCIGSAGALTFAILEVMGG